jgi:hypothetical protein
MFQNAMLFCQFRIYKASITKLHEVNRSKGDILRCKGNIENSLVVGLLFDVMIIINRRYIMRAYAVVRRQPV